ncbi:PASTA domain-containing protein, partial [Sinomonas atrocyanea]
APATSALPLVGDGGRGADAAGEDVHQPLYAPEDDEQPEPPVARKQRKRSPLTWPLVALLLLLLFVLIGVWLSNAGLFSPSPLPSTAPSSSSAAPSTSSAPPTSEPPSSTAPPAPATVTIVPSNYIGQNYTQVKSQLEELGMNVALNAVQSQTGTMGQVTDVTPAGQVTVGSTITVTYLSVQPPVTVPPAPSSTAPPKSSPAKSQTPSQTAGALPSTLPIAPSS